MYDNEVVQYEAWLQASPSKIHWKMQGQKSYYGSPSFEQKNATDEEIQPVEVEQRANMSTGRMEKGNNREEVFNVDSSNSQDPDLVDNPRTTPSMLIGDSTQSTKSKEVK